MPHHTIPTAPYQENFVHEGIIQAETLAHPPRLAPPESTLPDQENFIYGENPNQNPAIPTRPHATSPSVPDRTHHATPRKLHIWGESKPKPNHTPPAIPHLSHPALP